MLNKKALLKSTLVKIIILIFSFILILGVINLFARKAESATAEAACRFTLAAREGAPIPIEVKGVKVTDIKMPRVCPILDVEAESPEEVYEYMARCKAMFGYFLIDDIFKGDDYSRHNCRTCFIVTTKKSDKWPKEGKSVDKIIEEMSEKVYEVFPAYDDYCKTVGGISGGFCADSEAECAEDMNFESDNKECKKKAKEGCCWSRYSCINKGGKCKKEGELDEKEWIKYQDPQWRCPSETKCYIHKDYYYSYLGYIVDYKGRGYPVVLTPIKANEVYWISYGEPNEKCKSCEEAGLGFGAVSGVTAGALAVKAASVIGIGISATGVGFIAVAAGVAAGVVVNEIAENVANTPVLKEIIQKREDYVIYLTTPEQARNADSCNVIE